MAIIVKETLNHERYIQTNLNKFMANSVGDIIVEELFTSFNALDLSPTNILTLK